MGEYSCVKWLVVLKEMGSTVFSKSAMLCINEKKTLQWTGHGVYIFNCVTQRELWAIAISAAL